MTSRNGRQDSRYRSDRNWPRRDSRQRHRADSSRRHWALSRSRGRRRSEGRRSRSRGRGEVRNALTYRGPAHAPVAVLRARSKDRAAPRRGGPRRTAARSVSSCSATKPSAETIDDEESAESSEESEESEEESEESEEEYESETEEAAALANQSANEDGDAALAKAIQKTKAEKEKQRRKDDKNDIVHFDWSIGQMLTSRYKVTKLLGDGTFGRVLLVEDQKKERKLAVKVIRNVEKYVRNAKREAEILDDIRQAGPKKAANCVRMYDTFWHKSPLGDYFCLAFEVLGASLYDYTRQNRFRGMWVQDIQSIARQSLEALEFLHDELKISHTDLKLENILFQTMHDHVPAEFLRMDLFLEAHPSQKGRKLAQYVRPYSSKIKLIDFGNATYELEHHSSVINTRQYRAPEVILAMGWNERSDLWSMGCIIMELYTGDLLFRTHESVEHLALMEKVMERFPPEMLAMASEARQGQFLTEANHAPCLAWPQNASSENSARHVRSQRKLHEMVLEQHRSIADFVASLLTLEPSRRPSASAALEHPFFCERFND